MVNEDIKPETKERRVFFKEIDLRLVVEKYNKWKETDHRRKLLAVKFNDGSIWYPRDYDIDLILKAKETVHKHNTQFPNIDKPDEKNEPKVKL